VPEAAPTVQVALADAAKMETSIRGSGLGPQARGNRLSHQNGVAQAQPQIQQVASYQPQFDTSAPASQPQTLGYAAADQKQADAIGALLLSQDRPETPL
jgi:hypothetical protein